MVNYNNFFINICVFFLHIIGLAGSAILLWATIEKAIDKETVFKNKPIQYFAIAIIGLFMIDSSLGALYYYKLITPSISQ